MSNPQAILHWYPESPFSQKVAWALQYKNIDFKSVIISRIEPRPLRRPLDGGYRKSPVLQIGNHTYCDSKAIFAELEARFPEPSFYPAGPDGKSTEAQISGLARWTDNPLFMSIVTQLPWELMGDEFVKDRSEFAQRAFDLNASKMAAPYLRQAVQSEMKIADTFVRERNESGKLWALGTQALSLLDLHFAMSTWFLKHMVGDDWIEANIPTLAAHLEKTLAAVRFNDLQKTEIIKAEDALKLAKEQSWALPNPTHDGTLDIQLGQAVTVMPTDTGMVPSRGDLVHSTLNETVIEHREEQYGFTSYTHFPVIGFVVLPQSSKL
ncbi:MAG: hypothetical protein EXX96DRAFT_255790 [Benjaminiella poitrasii]|nr:MAG: hypothetical protein EXX96DRAFT_255790 [Benjaminiella poitrasii]